MGMTALVTGGAGFIGSHLAQRLLADGAEVIVLDNLSTGSLKNLETFRSNPKLQFVKGDIRDSTLVQLLTSRSEAVFHLAAAVGVQLIADAPVHTIETNIAGTEVVLEAANKFGRRILLASSSEVYGKSENVPFHGTMTSCSAAQLSPAGPTRAARPSTSSWARRSTNSTACTS